MRNFFEELQQKGVKQIEITFEELQNLFVEGRITQEQFVAIIIDQIGIDGYLKFMNDAIDKKKENQVQ